MMKMKKAVSMLLCMLLLCMSMSACGNGGGGDKDSSGKANEGEVEITWWVSYSTAYTVYFDELIEQFNELHDGEYHVTQLYNGGDDELRTKVATTEQKELPNLIIGTPMATAYFDEQDNIIPVQKFIDEDEEDWTGAIYDAVKDSYRNADGEMIGVPLGVSCPGYYVNVDMLKKAGYTVDDITSYEKIAKIASDIVSKKVATYGISHYYGYDLADALTLQGVHFYDNENGHAGEPTKSLIKEGATYDALKKYMEIYASLYKDGVAYSYKGDLKAEILPSFVQGDLAMLGATTSYVSQIVDLQPDFKWQFVSTLSVDDNAAYKGAAMCEGHGIYIVDNGNEKAAQGAYEFLKFMAQPESQAYWCMNTGYLPYTEEAYTNADYQTWMKENFPDAVDMKEKFLAPPEGLKAPYSFLISAVQDACNICKDYMFADPTQNLDEVIGWAYDSMEEAIEINAIRK